MSTVEYMEIHHKVLVLPEADLLTLVLMLRAIRFSFALSRCYILTSILRCGGTLRQQMDLFNFPDRLPVASSDGILRITRLWLNAAPVWNYTMLDSRYCLTSHHPPPRAVWQSAPRLSDLIENEDWSLYIGDAQTLAFFMPVSLKFRIYISGV